MKTLPMTAIALLVITFGFSAQAAERGDSMRFPYEPHETSTVEGAAALLQRIEFYAQGQCRLIKTGVCRTLSPKSVRPTW